MKGALTKTLVSSVAASCLLFNAAPALALAGDDDPFGSLQVMSRDELQAVRGGLDLGPFKAAIAIDITTSLNNELEVTTHLVPTTDGIKNLGTTISTAIKGSADDIPSTGSGQSPALTVPGAAALTSSSPDDVGTAVGQDLGTAAAGLADQVVQTVAPPHHTAAPQNATADAGPGAATQSPSSSGVPGAGSPLPSENVVGTAETAVAPPSTVTSTVTPTGAEVIFDQPALGGMTRVVHETVNGHFSLIENTASGLDILHNVRFDLRLLNVNALQGLMTARSLANMMQDTNILNLPR